MQVRLFIRIETDEAEIELQQDADLPWINTGMTLKNINIPPVGEAGEETMVESYGLDLATGLAFARLEKMYFSEHTLDEVQRVMCGWHPAPAKGN